MDEHTNTTGPYVSSSKPGAATIKLIPPQESMFSLDDGNSTNSLGYRTVKLPPTTSFTPYTVAEKIYDLPDNKFKKLYRQSAALNALGKFFFFITSLYTLSLLGIWLFPETVDEFVGWVIAGLCTFVVYTGSLSNLFNKQRNESAGKTIKKISCIYLLNLALAMITFGVTAFSTLGAIIFALASVVIFFIFYTTFQAAKNPLLFNEETPSHTQIKYIKQCREKSFFEDFLLPKARKPMELDAFFRTYAYVGTILFFILSVLGFFGAVTQAIIEEINNASNPQEYVQKADQAMEKKNFGDAFNLYEKAAKQNLPEGIFNLGICYAEGIGCDEDFAKAYECFNHPDVKDAPLAKFYIGIMHYSGQGAPQDFQKAAELLKSAADSGVEAAQKFLGYQNGKMPDYDVPLAKLLKENFKQNEKN